MTFSLFRHLPPELRRQIWETALGFSSPDKEICVLARAQPQPDDGRLRRPLAVHRAYSPLLAACGESRGLALERSRWAPGGVRPFDPASDILYVGGDVFNVFVGKLCCFPAGGGGGGGSEAGTEMEVPLPPPKWVREIRHLALDLRVARAGLWLPLSLEHLPRLETVAVVFPRAEGAMDVHASARVPDHHHHHVETRVLGAAETDAMVVEADYLFETYMGEHPVQWRKSATEYMRDDVAAGLARDVAANAESPSAACWDKENHRLLLQFEARCFV